MKCELCLCDYEYDEGKQIDDESFICYGCINEEKYGDLKNE